MKLGTEGASGMKILQLAVPVGVVWLLSGCAHLMLTERAKEIREISEPLPSCEYLDEVAGGARENIFLNPYIEAHAQALNNAASLGANYIQFTQKTSEAFKGLAFKCSPTIELSEPELGKQCDDGNANACLDLSWYRDESNPRAAWALLKRSCTLGSERGCRGVKEMEIKVAANEKEAAALEAQAKAMGVLRVKCERKNTKVCLELSFELYKRNRHGEALEYAQKACVGGSMPGCDFSNQLMQMRRDYIQSIRDAQTQLNLQTQTMLQFQQLHDQQRQRSNEQMQQLINSMTTPARAPGGVRCTSRVGLGGTTVMDCD